MWWVGGWYKTKHCYKLLLLLSLDCNNLVDMLIKTNENEITNIKESYNGEREKIIHIILYVLY